MKTWTPLEELEFVFSLQFWRMGLLWTLQLLYSYFKAWTTPHSHPRRPPPPSPQKPICIITGATSGLGAAAAHALAREGFYVVLLGRSTDLLSKVVEDIINKHPGADAKMFEIDLMSFKSIVRFIRSFQVWLKDINMHCSLQLLVNNAGILATTQGFTDQGHDRMMGTNYVGAFVLTNLLLPLLQNSVVPSRIVNVTSFTHRSVSTIEVDEETLFGNCSLPSEPYPYAEIYESSKLCLVLFSYELHRQLHLVGGPTQVSVMAADPGAVATNIWRELPWHVFTLACAVLKLLGLLQSPEDGVNSIIDAALAPPEISGEYFFGGGGRTIPSSELSYDTKLAERLWNSSANRFLPTLASVKEL